MARNPQFQKILIILLLIIFICAFATKAAHWDTVAYKNQTKDYWDEVYPGLEGMIATDVILFVLYAVALFFAFKPNEKFGKILAILIVLMLFIRIILSLLFLAGNDEMVKKLVDACEDQPETSCFFNGITTICRTTTCGTDGFKTLKGAWIMEIIAIILVNIIAPITLFMMLKK